MAYWILKTEPSTYSFDDLVAAKTATWDGVANPVALRNMRSMKKGDTVAIYHTGDEKAVVGLASVASEPYGDPTVVDLKAGKKLARPLTLATMKAEPLFADSPVSRQPRLSVIPVNDKQWEYLLKSPTNL